jgi:outer membrane lipoprotein-sorting protein
MERVFGITLAPRALHAVLIGDIPVDTLPPGGKVAYLPKHDLYRWEGQIPQQPGYYRVWFAASHLLPVRFEVEDLLGRVVLRVQYENFQQLPEFMLPYEITVEQPLVDQQVTWRYSDVRVNVGVTPALFQMRVPAGIERIELH